MEERIYFIGFEYFGGDATVMKNVIFAPLFVAISIRNNS